MRLSRGDTIIEVLLAITIFSMLSVGVMTIMNQGTNTAQRALEITLVRQQIDAQAEAIRATQQAAAANYRTAWDAIAIANSPAYPDFTTTCPKTTADIPNAFIMDARSARPYTTGSWMADVNVSSSVPFAQVDYTSGNPVSYGMWIERQYQSPTATLPALYTFTVKSCWLGAGLDRPMNLETVVRLYDPGT